MGNQYSTSTTSILTDSHLTLEKVQGVDILSFVEDMWRRRRRRRQEVAAMSVADQHVKRVGTLRCDSIVVKTVPLMNFIAQQGMKFGCTYKIEARKKTDAISCSCFTNSYL